MRTRQKIHIIFSVMISLILMTSFSALAVDYAKPVALKEGAQADFKSVEKKGRRQIASGVYAAGYRVQLLHRHW